MSSKVSSRLPTEMIEAAGVPALLERMTQAEAERDAAIAALREIEPLLLNPSALRPETNAAIGLIVAKALYEGTQKNGDSDKLAEARKAEHEEAARPVAETLECLHCAVAATMNAWAYSYVKRTKEAPPIGEALRALAKNSAELIAGTPKSRTAYEVFLKALHEQIEQERRGARHAH